MCGIAGQFGTCELDFAHHALRLLGHRGPDSNGVWQGEKTTLIHTRLAIIDTGSGGNQPMVLQGLEETDAISAPLVESVSPDEGKFAKTTRLHHGARVLVFNGEIYNYRELRGELEKSGETFSTDSDTEVLLRLLIREGIEALPKLAGMFAFAYWDEETKIGLLARDPLGIKPLYYRSTGGGMSFASESKVLFQSDDPLDSTALRDFLLWGSMCKPATLSSKVRELKAGHYLQWKGGEFLMKRWAAEVLDSRMETGLRRFSSYPSYPSYPETVSRVREALEETVRRHLVSDVPVGIFLSGGIDSTVLLALTRRLLGPEAEIRTFSIGFKDPHYDESHAAARSAAHFGAVHTEWMITSEEAVNELAPYLNAMDQPTIDGFNTWCVSSLARRSGIKVVLSGLGADELFGGYTSFQRIPFLKRLYRMTRLLRWLASFPLQYNVRFKRLAEFLNGDGKWLEVYHAQRGIFTVKEADLLAEQLSGSTPVPMNWKTPVPLTDVRDVVSFLEITRYMRNQLLRDSDVFSMAHGLELRVPFVDARLIKTMETIPAKERLASGKKLLIDAIPEIPEWILNKPKKGFVFPFNEWVKGRFSKELSQMEKQSPFPLISWYRCWALMVAEESIRKLRNKEKS